MVCAAVACMKIQREEVKWVREGERERERVMKETDNGVQGKISKRERVIERKRAKKREVEK